MKNNERSERVKQLKDIRVLNVNDIRVVGDNRVSGQSMPVLHSKELRTGLAFGEKGKSNRNDD